ncbi:MAG: hypothetical protein LC808_04550 [Actinobacteria bacterium]|nr:hypothetical protein [Actinomycetota bacterium]
MVNIRVKDAGELGYVIIGGATYPEGVHELWNYEEVKEWPDFKKLVDEGKIELLD